jgi:hypothetical protein
MRQTVCEVSDGPLCADERVCDIEHLLTSQGALPCVDAGCQSNWPHTVRAFFKRHIHHRVAAVNAVIVMSFTAV